MQKIVTSLWFDTQAEEAAKFYTSIFKNSKLGRISRRSDAVAALSEQPSGAVLGVEFQLDGQAFIAFNGGPMFKFTEAISLSVNCVDQAEIDRMWDALCDGGQASQCGWLKDKFGLSWQVVPSELNAMISHSDSAKVERVMSALLGMQKLDIATLRQAFEG